ncbi:hypothetical protein FRC08_013748 [Ceratobasidium sp. 394]|nr:hypothetical protein FRC08_013748 [Ceratobasidium sp. 394]
MALKSSGRYLPPALSDSNVPYLVHSTSEESVTSSETERSFQIPPVYGQPPQSGPVIPSHISTTDESTFESTTSTGDEDFEVPVIPPVIRPDVIPPAFEASRPPSGISQESIVIPPLGSPSGIPGAPFGIAAQQPVIVVPPPAQPPQSQVSRTTSSSSSSSSSSSTTRSCRSHSGSPTLIHVVGPLSEQTRPSPTSRAPSPARTSQSGEHGPQIIHIDEPHAGRPAAPRESSTTSTESVLEGPQIIRVDSPGSTVSHPQIIQIGQPISGFPSGPVQYPQTGQPIPGQPTPQYPAGQPYPPPAPYPGQQYPYPGQPYPPGQWQQLPIIIQPPTIAGPGQSVVSGPPGQPAVIRIDSSASPGSHAPQIIQVEPAHDSSPGPQIIRIGSPGHTGPVTGTHPDAIIVEGSVDSDAGPQLSMYPTLGVRICAQGHLPRYTVIALIRIDGSRSRSRSPRIIQARDGTHRSNEPLNNRCQPFITVKQNLVLPGGGERAGKRAI